MEDMTTHERVTTVYAHREPDRVPVTDWIWESTIARWRSEGLPENADRDHFGLDDIVTLGEADIDTSPQFQARVIEETDTYRIEQDHWGVTKKNFKPVSTTPMYSNVAIRDRQTWEAARKRMTPTRDRINWQRLTQEYEAWRERGAWIVAAPWFGWDIVNARMCGTENTLYAMADDPAWPTDMFNHGCDLALALLDMIWDEGYTFDELMWFDDMAYRGGMIFSKKMWRQMVRPYQRRTIDWAHAHGIKAHLHCCGNINALIPELIDMGLDALNPLEVKAGMDPIQMKRTYGRDLVLRGGCNALHWDDWRKVEAGIRRLLPVMMEGGGYIFASDHSVPDNTSLETYRSIVALVRELGAY